MRAHGETSVTLQGNLIEATFSGSFNAAGIREYADKIVLLLAQLNGQPFTMIIDNLALIGGTPEAYAELDKYNQWLNEQALIAKAMLIESKLKSKIIASLSPQMQQQNIRHFDDREEALAWLKEEAACYSKHAVSSNSD